ncbi:MAG TPA: hypothetical protein VHL11_20385, partial [Phototrophicaceae bacterium]|nr:hypothetical protein [Phototrophicaceae bacterium]
MTNLWNEPPVEPQDDTHPTSTFPQIAPESAESNQETGSTGAATVPTARQRWIGIVMLLAAAGLTLITGTLLISP